MSCRELAERLMEYVAGELEAAHRAELDAHVCLCPQCLAQVQTYRVTVRAARRLEQRQLPEGFRVRLTSVLHVEVRRCRGESS